MFGAIIVSLVGIIFVVLGYLLWKKERIELLHGYHYDKVAKEDNKIFCAISGLGVIIIGLGLLITGGILAITDSAWSFIAFVIGFLVGLAMLIYAGGRYNRS